MKATLMSIGRQMDKEVVVHIHNGILLSYLKKNTFKSVLMRWMKLEPIKQSEASQKEKHQYSILTHPLFRNCGYFLLVRKSSSVQFCHLVMSDCLWPHELQHARPPCPSPTPGVHPNPCPGSLGKRHHGHGSGQLLLAAWLNPSRWG